MDAFAELLRPLLGSAAVLGALLLVRRRVAAHAGPRTGGRLRVADRVAVGRGSAVVVVEVDERRFLVGAGEQGLRLLSELTPLPVSPAAATDGDPVAGADPAIRTPTRPTAGDDGFAGSEPGRSAPLDRLRRATVRTHVEAPLRELT